MRFVFMCMTWASAIFIRAGHGGKQGVIPPPLTSKPNPAACVGVQCTYHSAVPPPTHKVTTQTGTQPRNMTSKQYFGRSFTGKPSPRNAMVPKAFQARVANPNRQNGRALGMGAMQRTRSSTTISRSRTTWRPRTKVPKLFTTPRSGGQGAQTAAPLTVKQPIMLTPADGQIPIQAGRAFQRNSIPAMAPQTASSAPKPASVGVKQTTVLADPRF